MNMKYWGHCLLFMLGLASVCSCTDSEKMVHYRGIAVDDANGSEGLYNPERGFRLETAVDLVTQKECPTLQLDTLSLKYTSDSVSLSQSYFYLTYLTDKKLSDAEFQTMQVYFDRLRQLGKKTVLRFAYEKDFVRQEPVGPTLKEALAHLDQLKPFLHKNRDLILVVQAGVIGAWGEWHSSIHGLEHSDTAKIAILEKLLEVVPAEKNVQVRLPEFKNLLKGKPELYKRVSFHDDFVVIKPDQQFTFNTKNGTIEVNKVDAARKVMWKDGVLVIDNEAFRDVIWKLERWYGVAIVNETGLVFTQSFSGEFDREDIHVAIESLCANLNITYMMDKDRIILKR